MSERFCQISITTDDPEDQRGILRDENEKDSDTAGGTPGVAVGSTRV
jgi:hypothetical protein